MSFTTTVGYTWSDGDVMTAARLNTASTVADNQSYGFASGSSGAPAVYFNAESTLGFFRYASGSIGISGGMYALNAAASNAFYLGQDSAHNLASVWTYNATATSATAVFGTYNKSNQLTIQASVLNIDSASLPFAVQVTSAGRVVVGAGADDGINALQTTTLAPRNIIPAVVAVTYGATTTIDFSSADYKTVTLTGNVTFASSNLAAGREAVVKIACDTSTRTLAFPGTWIWLGTAPTSIAANKVAILSLTSYSTTDASVVAAYAVQL